MPSNNLWFVEYLEKHQVLGWLDYLAHDFGDPAVLGTVINQMGNIYSAFTAVPQYLLDPTKTAAAMKLGWIFQENAFAFIDEAVMLSYMPRTCKVYRPGCSMTSAARTMTPPAAETAMRMTERILRPL